MNTHCFCYHMMLLPFIRCKQIADLGCIQEDVQQCHNLSNALSSFFLQCFNQHSIRMPEDWWNIYEYCEVEIIEGFLKAGLGLVCWQFCKRNILWEHRSYILCRAEIIQHWVLDLVTCYSLNTSNVFSEISPKQLCNVSQTKAWL